MLPLLVQATTLIGHRGARGLYPENTIPAFQSAIELGVNGVELDVVITADKHVLVSHDAYMAAGLCRHPDHSPITRTEQKKLNIYHMTYAQTQDYDCGSLYQAAYPRQVLQVAHKPLLAKVLIASEAILQQQHRQAIQYFIEIKSHHHDYGIYQPYPEEFVDLVYRVIKAHVPLSQVVVISFDPAILRLFHQRYPDIQLGMLVNGDETVNEVLNVLGFVPSYYSPRASTISASNVEHCHALHMQVVSWVVNSVDEFHREADLGLDGIVTDYPDLISK